MMAYFKATVWIFVALLLASSAIAADVSVGLSQRETYVGLPVTLQIKISDAEDYEAPLVPEVDGLTIRSTGTPTRNSQISIINGRRSDSSSITYTYRIIPQREGTFTIPPIPVTADGKTTRTSKLQIVATKSETGDLMFVEIVGKQDSIYVGEALELTLKIWLRPYRDKDRGVVLSEADMWNLISNETNWGPFAERLEELSEDNKRPGGEEVLRADNEGDQRSYFLYEIDATVYPQRPGKIDGDDVQIIVQYPTSLGKSRDPFASFFGDDSFPFKSRLFDDDFFSSPFGSRLSVTSIRPIVAETAVEPIEVKPIPSEGRPADYRGAVGQYQIATEAKPTKVKAGDPITLHIGVSGSGPMELVQAPPLSRLSELTDGFKVPDEPLAGFVDGSQKVFSTTIRPKQQGITQIPPVPLSYFDPDQEKFITVYSDPISIAVDEAETLDLSAIVGSSADRSAKNSSAEKPTSRVSFVNFTGSAVLQNEMPPTPITALQWALLAIPPLVVAAIAVVRLRYPIFNITSLVRSPVHRACAEVGDAEHGRDVKRALMIYLQRRLRKQITANTPAASIGALRRLGHRDLAIRVERIIAQCEQTGEVVELKSSAIETLHDLEKKLKQPIRRTVRGRNTSIHKPPARRATTIRKASVLLAVLATVNIHSACASETKSASLTNEQAEILLDEANELYKHAYEAFESAPAESKDHAGRSSQKYQLLVDSGIRNSRLYFNLANAYHLGGQRGRAIANYHRAVNLDPTNRTYRANLESVLSSIKSVNSQNAAPGNLINTVARINQAVNRFVSPATIGQVAIIAWTALWSVIAARLLRISVPWKSLATASAFLFVLTASSYSYSMHEYATQDAAILVRPEVELRSGDGPNFPTVAKIDDAEGRKVQIAHRRGQWAKVNDGNRSGWIPLNEIEVL